MDKRFPRMQELLEEAVGKIQGLYVQATAGNVDALQKTIMNLQVVYNTLGAIQKEQQEVDENEREADPE